MASKKTPYQVSKMVLNEENEEPEIPLNSAIRKFDLRDTVETLAAPTAGAWNKPQQPQTRHNREWDNQHPGRVFRGVPRDLQDRILDIADEMKESHGIVGGASAVASVFLDYALIEYQAGNVQIPIREVTNLRWSSDTWNTSPKTKTTARSRKVKDEKKSKPARATYRFSPEQMMDIHTVIDQERKKAIPNVIRLTLGETLTHLLGYALRAYDEGRLSLVAEARTESKAFPKGLPNQWDEMG